MTNLLILVLLTNLASFIMLGFFPEYYTGLLYFLVIIFIFGVLHILHQSKKYKFKKQDFVSIFANFLLFMLIGYITEIRLSLNPFGMLDAYAMWIGKGRMLALSILDGNPIPLWNQYWRMPNYPLGIPLLHADLSLVFSSVNSFLITAKIPNYLYLALLYLFFTDRLLEIKNPSIRWGFIILTGTFLFHPNYLLVVSDLCADFPVSVTFAIATYYLIERDKKKSQVLLFLSLSLLTNLKSEALLITIVILVFFFFLSYIERRITKQFLILGLFLLVAFGAPTWYLLAKGSFLSSDFKAINQSSPGTNFILERLLNGSLWLLVIDFFLKFYLSLTKGFLLTLLLLVLFWGSLNLRITVLLYLISISIYTGIFLLTSLDPQVHLEQAFDRIHFQLYLIPLVIFWKFTKDNEEKISEKLRLILNYANKLREQSK
ncbi:hypothetical protein ND861_10845 [Leptospira sp. 2 VSF19]|uniref:Glycosyltransferase RgtA/B/C/D-like domain-containing protein n=1 Tax=Leptospira soteropolitanensis TaxID=2950025 RepID=A0AAW5VD19_9LEPT|nr:hypothetical protein [Leptospira soteropolitanensis]MCW7493201.1 hypothetical protein [Leptospira soteropolitanensis]MCW7500730.1 hypothetical protein [Leptospira soteropolitanensis]MCW7523051.1 hypothetical protein [Leptospira soteropolitanensis]MCW7526842.1 hypothetical protein [Leptospira soteropolitanensis]MCW7530769.1 hypothetical protein [Leptospira soteropolitanensis]